jgi:predicted nucleotidyltransferase
MRLKQKEIDFIKEVVLNFLPESKIYIFGSMLKKTKGGDIDIFVIPKEKLNIKTRLLLQAKIEDILEEEFLRSVDVIISKDLNREIEKEAIKGKLI